jgi:hypothetical protein
MKKQFFLLLTILIAMSTVGVVIAKEGWSKNRNDGCAAQGGAVWVNLHELAIPVAFPPTFPDDFHFSYNGAWLGGACCASNKVDFTAWDGSTIYIENSCCRPPDDLVPMIGNHCICFEIREYEGFPYPT